MNELHFSIAVGIDIYPSFTPLAHARDDAAAFNSWVLEPTGGNLPGSNAFLIQAAESEFAAPEMARPTREQVHDAMREVHQRIDDAVRKDPRRWVDTRLYFYLAGHGIAPTVQDSALLLANATQDEIGQNLPCMLYLNFYEKTQKAKEVVFFTDCCREVVAGAPGDGPPFTAALADRGEVQWMAAMATQHRKRAFEPTAANLTADEQRGYFTRALLEGLRGHAVDPTTGNVDSVSLERYVRQRVADLTRHLPFPQMPHVRRAGGLIVFRAAPAPGTGTNDGSGSVRTFTVTIQSSPGFSGTLELWDQNYTKLQEHAADGQPWSVELPAGLYEVRASGLADNPFRNEGLFRVMGGDRNVEL